MHLLLIFFYWLLYFLCNRFLSSTISNIKLDKFFGFRLLYCNGFRLSNVVHFICYVVKEFYQKTLYVRKLTTTCRFHRNQSLHAIVHDSAKDNDTDVEDEKINEYSNSMDSAARSKDDNQKEIHWNKSTRYINAQKECTKFNGKVLLDIDPLDNPLKVFEKLINLD